MNRNIIALAALAVLTTACASQQPELSHPEFPSACGMIAVAERTVSQNPLPPKGVLPAVEIMAEILRETDALYTAHFEDGGDDRLYTCELISVNEAEDGNISLMVHLSIDDGATKPVLVHGTEKAIYLTSDYWSSVGKHGNQLIFNIVY